MTVNECVYLGYITKTKGLKGEMQIYFEIDAYLDLDLDVLFLEMDKKLVPYFVKSIKIQANKTGYLFLEDVDHIDVAKKLVHKSIYFPLDKMPERDPDEFLLSDLKGYRVHDKQQGDLGEIIAIQELPQQDIAVVQHQFREILFPLNEDFILEIDKEDACLYVDLPEGLIDIYRAP